MAKALKVIGGCTFYKGKQVRVIAAVKSKAEMARLIGATSTQMRDFFCETGNQKELAVALAEPGVAFYSPLSYERDFKKMEKE